MMRKAIRCSVVLYVAVFLGLAGCSQDEAKPPVGVGTSRLEGPAEAVAEAYAQLKVNLKDQDPGLVIVSTVGAKYEPNVLLAALAATLPATTKLWGYTSLERGVFLPSGYEPKAISLLGLAYSGMQVGVGTAEYAGPSSATPTEPGRLAILAALADAGKTPLDPPTAILITGPSGANESAILDGIESVVGPNVPIVGGNAAGLRPEGTLGERNYYQFSRAGLTQNNVLVAALYGSFKVAAHFGYYHDPVPEHTGIATKADVTVPSLSAIDGQAAAPLYNQWVGGIMTSAIAEAASNAPSVVTWLSSDVWAANSLKVPVTGDENGPYIMAGPVGLYSDGSTNVCCHPIEAGKRLTHMQFNEARAASAAADFAEAARLTASIPKDDLAGLFFVYCDSPFLVAPQIGALVTQNVQERYGANLPFVGMISAGEMGYTQAAGNWFVAFSAVAVLFTK